MQWYDLDNLADDATQNGSTQDDATACNPQVPLLLRALAYGDGFFTTMAVHNGHILWQAYHQARLRGHLAALFMSLPEDSQQRLWHTTAKFASAIHHGIIKIMLVRKAQAQPGYGHSSLLADNGVWVRIGKLATPALASQTAQFLVSASIARPSHRVIPCATNQPNNKLINEPNLAQEVLLQQPAIAATCLQQQLACLPAPLAGLKTLNRLDSVLIAGELQRLQQSLSAPSNVTLAALGEGLVRDMAGNWVEGVMSNVFYQLNDGSAAPPSSSVPLGQPQQWFTPPIDNSGVAGVMRQVIIDTLENTAAPVQQRRLRDKDLTNISALFFCNAVRGVIPVRALRIDATTTLNLCVAIYSTGG